MNRFEQRHYQDLLDGAGTFKFVPPALLGEGHPAAERDASKRALRAAVREQQLKALTSVFAADRPRERIGDQDFTVLDLKPGQQRWS